MARASGNRSAASVRVCGSAASAGERIGQGHTEEVVEVVYARGEREDDDIHDEERDWLDQPWFASRVGGGRTLRRDLFLSYGREPA